MYTIRAIQFYLKGKSQFTNAGYALNSKKFNPQDLNVDLSGQHMIITGANSGIGYSAALQLANKGAEIHLVCRNKQRGEEALEQLKKESTNSKKIYLHLCDMSEFKSIKQFYDDYIKQGYPVNGLIHNAGTMLHERQMTSDNLEFNFATNTAGVYFMTELFIPQLHQQTQQNKQAKVILVSSGGMYTQTLEYEDLNLEKIKKFDGMAQYAKNKRQQIVLCEEWAKKYTSTKGIQFYSMHPGWVDTPVLPVAMPEFYKKFKTQLRKCEEGSDTIYWLICKNQNELKSGDFYFDRESVEKHLSISLTSHKTKDVEIFINKLNNLISSYIQ